MRRCLESAPRLPLLSALSLVGVVGMAVPIASFGPAPARMSLGAAHCDALGAYPTGPRVAAHVVATASIQPPPSPWRLVGHITLTSYSGCGHPNAGTFAVQGLLMGTPIETGGITVTLPCAQSCLGPPLATISTTGTFRQDTHDPLSVRVTATLHGARATGAHPQVTLGGIEGYLEVVPGQSVRLTVLPPPALSFLPPATVNAGVLPVPLIIYGWRGM